MNSGGELRVQPRGDQIDRVARAWIAALVAKSSLEHLAALRLDLLALDAPALVEGLLTRQEDPAGIGALQAAAHGDPARCVGAAELLRACLASELAAAGSYSAEDADALATAVACAAEAALDGDRAATGGVSSGDAELPAADLATGPGDGQPAPGTRGDAVVYDEAAAVHVASEGLPEPTAIGAHDTRERSWEHDLDTMIDRHGAEGLAFALIAAQLAEARLVEAADGSGELERLTGAVSRSMCAALPAASAVSAPAGRVWLIVPAGDDREAARSLRVAGDAASQVRDRRGEQVMLDAGYALCPSDGQEPAALRRQAELSLGAAGPRV
jgi:hypothetical protein